MTAPQDSRPCSLSLPVPVDPQDSPNETADDLGAGFLVCFLAALGSVGKRRKR